MAKKGASKAMVKAKAAYKRAVKTSKPGAGARSKALKKVVALGGAKNPGAVIAKIGRAKYGKARFQKMAAAGKK